MPLRVPVFDSFHVFSSVGLLMFLYFLAHKFQINCTSLWQCGMRRRTRRIHWAVGAIHGACGDCTTNCTRPCANPELLIPLPMDPEDEADNVQRPCIRCGPVVAAAVTPVDSSSESSDEQWTPVESVHNEPPQPSSYSGPRDSWFTDPVVRDLAGDVLSGRTYLADRKSVFILALERPTARIQLSVYYERLACAVLGAAFAVYSWQSEPYYWPGHNFLPCRCGSLDGRSCSYCGRPHCRRCNMRAEECFVCRVGGPTELFKLEQQQ